MEQKVDARTLAAAMAIITAATQGTGVATKGVVGSTPTTTYGHGQGGLFSYPGLSKPVFSAMVLPRGGVINKMPVRPSREDNPLYGIFTGQTATTGSEPVNVCDDPPVVGLSKLCTHSFVFGRQSRMTRVFDVDRSGRWTNRGEFGDLTFLGNPFQNQTFNAPTVPGQDGMNAVLNTEVGKALFELAVGWTRDFARVLYTGNPTNNTAGGGSKQFDGFDRLINTGYRDAITGQVCPAADGIVRSFGSLDIGTNAASFIRTITNMHRNLKYVASHVGLDPVKWIIAMPWALFYELTEVWPCAYLSYRCTNLTTGSTQFIDSTQQIAMRDGMRADMYEYTGQYLLIDGERVEVVIDDNITETVLAGESFTSSIYFIPLTVLGGVPTTFLEHIDYDTPGGAMDMARAMAPDGFYSTSDGGRFLWHKKLPNNFCVQMLAKTEPRLLLLTPHLSARLTNVKYTPVAHQRDWDTASSYFVNGGKTDYGGFGPSFFTPVP